MNEINETNSSNIASIVDKVEFNLYKAHEYQLWTNWIR